MSASSAARSLPGARRVPSTADGSVYPALLLSRCATESTRRTEYQDRREKERRSCYTVGRSSTACRGSSYEMTEETRGTEMHMALVVEGGAAGAPGARHRP